MTNLNNICAPAAHDIRIDKDGTWYYQGAEMVRKEIVNFFYRHLKRDQEGRYLIEHEKERYYLDVDDTPFVIKSVHRSLSDDQGEEEVFDMLMPDDSMERLDPATLRVGNDNALYCTIARLGVEARFSRASYYQIAQYIEQDSSNNEFYISLNGYRYPIGNNNGNRP